MQTENLSLEEMTVILKDALSSKEPSDQHYDYSKQVCKQNFKEGIDIVVNWLEADEDLFKLLAMSSLLHAESIKGDQDVISSLHQMAFDDMATSYHGPAAALLGQISQWPDEGLSHLMIESSNQYIKAAAFQSALELAGVSYHTAKQYAGQVETGELEPTPELVDKIAKENQ